MPMIRTIVTLIAVLMFLVSCSGSGTLVSIREHPWDQAVKVDYLRWEPGEAFGHYSSSRYATAFDFMGSINSGDMSFPFVMWDAGGERYSAGFQYSKSLT